MESVGKFTSKTFLKPGKTSVLVPKTSLSLPLAGARVFS